MNSKKGMADIITTIIMIALALVAVGIVWGVVSNTLGEAKSDVAGNAACTANLLEVSYTATATDATVNVKRVAGTDVLSAIKVVVYNATASNTANIATNVPILEAKSVTIALAGVNKVSATPVLTGGIVCTNAVEKKN